MKAQKKRIKTSPQAPPVVQEVEREKIPGKVEYEIVREKDKRSVIVKKGKISPRKELLIYRFQGTKRIYYPNHIIKETQGKKTRYFIRWNAYFTEAYDKEGKLSYDQSAENIRLNSMMEQLGKAVGAAVGFVLERPMLYLLAIAFLVSIPIGFSYNDIFNWVPRTVVHWVPRA